MVRHARLDDAAAIARVHTETWKVAYRGVVRDDVLDGLVADGTRLEGWRRTIENDALRVLVVEEEASVVGFACGGASRDVDLPGTGEIYAIYVEPTSWRRGLGRELRTAAEHALRELSFADASLWVLEENARARRFYEACGWTLDNLARKPLPGGPARGLIEVRYRRKL